MCTTIDRFVAALIVAGVCLGPVLATAEPFAYVTASDFVSVIDTATNTLVATVPVGTAAWRLAITPDGTTVYVTNRFSNSVSVIDTATNGVVATVPVGGGPLGVAITPDGTRVYVANGDSQSISVISTVTNTVVSTIAGVGRGPTEIAVTPDGASVYVTDGNGGSVWVIDTATGTVVATVPVGLFPLGVAVTGDGTKAYVANQGSTSLSVIGTVTNTVVKTIPLSSDPREIAFTPDGSRAYVTTFDFGLQRGAVTIVDTVAEAEVATIELPDRLSPVGIAITPDGATAYLAIPNDDKVWAIDTAAGTVVATVFTSNGSQGGIAITPSIVTVTIDIKPGSFPNSVNLSSKGVVPVAILSGSTFDAGTVDPATITLAGARVRLIGKADRYSCARRDVNDDGLLDLVCHVLTEELTIVPGESIAVLEAETFGGQHVRGVDSIQIVRD